MVEVALLEVVWLEVVWVEIVWVVVVVVREAQRVYGGVHGGMVRCM